MVLGRATVIVAASLLALTTLPAGAAQSMCEDPAVKCCNEDFQLFIRNPELRPGADGRFHITGDFLMQFQVIGDNADQIEVFAFSVGLPVDDPQEICTAPVWPGGFKLEAYKVDLDKEDGFFIYQTTNGDSTPQNVDLSVAVHAYDGDGNELARFWSMAVVENCPDIGPGCSDDPGAIQRDQTLPWPMILPGDGSKTYVDGFTVEFGEPLDTLVVELNGEDITDQMEPWEGLVWDRDTFYDYGPAGIFNELTPMCTLPSPIHSCDHSKGPAYQWTQRPMTDDDVIRVIATDLNGNLARKEIHVGSSVAGGVIADGIPILQMTFEESSLQVEPGSTAVFRMRMENNGAGEGHPFASAEVPEGWHHEWIPGHRPVPAGAASEQELHVTVPHLANTGTFPVKAIVDYRQGSEDRRLQSNLNVEVVLPEGGTNTTAGGPIEEDSEGSPLPLAWLPLLAAAFVARRRTRT